MQRLEGSECHRETDHVFAADLTASLVSSPAMIIFFQGPCADIHPRFQAKASCIHAST